MFFIGLIRDFSFDNNNYLVCDRAEKRRVGVSEMVPPPMVPVVPIPLELKANRLPATSCTKGVPPPGRQAAFHPEKKHTCAPGSTQLQAEAVYPL